MSGNAAEYVIRGPTFTYRLQKQSGAINSVGVTREGREVVASRGPFDLRLDGQSLWCNTTGEVALVTETREKVVARAQGIWRDPAKRKPDLDCTLQHTFFNDGVVVSSVKLVPRGDLAVEQSLALQLPARGAFTHYLQKRRDEHGDSAARGRLPEAGGAVRFSTLTSCLQAFSSDAALAIFTDAGATPTGAANLETAMVEVGGGGRRDPEVLLAHWLIHVEPNGKPFVLKAGKEFAFRAGISVTPSRAVSRRRHDLRMFAWVGDRNYPYASDREIEQVAQAGFTLFQMHRLGNPGEPRPPAGELERVIRKVHDCGMLFLWTENADLMYDRAPGVQELKAKGQWHLWQGFNYGGQYKAAMDPYCDLAATCLASPNGLAEYRLATIRRMLERFEVDGIYLDDNLAYPNCTLGREHGHPQPVYDCLIELHEMNWARRQLLRGECPHSVLVSHSTRAIVLPVVCDFDAVLYGEGYSFGSLENYWEYYRPVEAIPAQGMIWPGGTDPDRCAASVAYNYDLLTGGGQYCHIDWRMFPQKFPYGAGVTAREHLYVETYNRAEYYFGLYESRPFYFAAPDAPFATGTPGTYASVYHNRVWDEWLVAVANMSRAAKHTSLEIHSPAKLELKAQREYVVLDTRSRTARRAKGGNLNQVFESIEIPAESLQLYCLRESPPDGPFHLWGGKKLSENWDRRQRRLTVTLQGPPGLEDTVFLAPGEEAIRTVRAGGKPQSFFLDPEQGLVHGRVTFARDPLVLEVSCAQAGANSLPHASVPPSALP